MPRAYREPMFNAPFPVTALIGALTAAWLVQAFALSTDQFMALALSTEAVRAGRYYQLITHIFLHAGLMHLVMNAAGVFAFGPPVVRLLGLRNGDIALFYLFFLVCGVVGGLGLVAWAQDAPVFAVGASGAVSGLWGGASRLLGRRGGLAPILDRNVLGMAAAFVIVNLIVGAFDFMLGIAIAWQSHIAGYVAGLLLIGPFARLAGRIR